MKLTNMSILIKSAKIIDANSKFNGKTLDFLIINGKIKEIAKELQPASDLPGFKSGDNITVYYRIKEGNKERIQFFKGDVLQRKGSGATETFTIRKISNGIAVERIFPVNSLPSASSS